MKKQALMLIYVLPQSEIIPILTDRGEFIASESTFHRILREEKENEHRGLTKKPHRKPKETHKPIAPNQVWMWDITYLKSQVRGLFHYLYLFIDLYCHKIIHWEVYEEQTAENASEFIRKAKRKENLLSTDLLVLHSDNGGPMKGAVMLETLYKKNEKSGIEFWTTGLTGSQLLTILFRCCPS